MQNFDSELAFANSRSRLRMVTLYQIAQSNNGTVVGTEIKLKILVLDFIQNMVMEAEIYRQ